MYTYCNVTPSFVTFATRVRRVYVYYHHPLPHMAQLQHYSCECLNIRISGEKISNQGAAGSFARVKARDEDVQVVSIAISHPLGPG